MSNGNGHRWSKFWWQDWQDDEGLKMCGFAAQGLWMRLLCVMHKANRIGHLLVNGKPPNIRQIVSLCGGSEKEVRQLMEELEENGVFSRDDQGIIFSRRMVKDAAQSEAGRESVARRWNGHDPSGGPNTPPNTSPNREPNTEPKSSPKREAKSQPKRDPITRIKKKEAEEGITHKGLYPSLESTHARGLSADAPPSANREPNTPPNRSEAVNDDEPMMDPEVAKAAFSSLISELVRKPQYEIQEPDDPTEVSQAKQYAALMGISLQEAEQHLRPTGTT